MPWRRVYDFPLPASKPLGEPKMAYEETTDLHKVVREHFGMTEDWRPNIGGGTAI